MTFDRLLVGVDGSPAGLVALRQALRLRAPGAPVVAVTVCHTTLAIHAGFDAPRIAAQLQDEAQTAQVEADAVMADHEHATSLLVEGRPVPVLAELIRRHEATLLVLGSHGGSRAGGMILGSVATELLHDARCSVLLAREPNGGETFPRQIVLGLDGSPHSARAALVAAKLAQRLGVALLPIAGEGGKYIERLAVEAIARELGGDVTAVRFDARPPVEALVGSAEEGDLIVLGSRGLHGIRALGSVSERVAHGAPCSVLVTRPASGQ